MGKAAQSRRDHRVQLLAKLANHDIDAFSNEWTIRLVSWSKTIERTIAALAGKWDGSKQDIQHILQVARNLINEVLNELQKCGEKAYGKWKEKTQLLLEYKFVTSVEQQWAVRLESWSEELGRRVAATNDRKLSAFSIMQEALDELAKCGESIFFRFADGTRLDLEHEFAQKVAQHRDFRMYRLTSTKRYCWKAAISKQKVPRL